MRVDPLFNLGLAGALNDLTARQNTLAAQLSSGLRVASAGDDPVAASQSVRLGSLIARDDAYVSTAANLQSRLQVGDSAMGSVITQVTSAISLAVKGQDGTLNASNLSTISQQMAGIRDEVLALANTSYAGGYLFGGTNAATQPFTNDTTTTPATATYAGDGNTQYATTPGGQKIATSVPGSQLFTSGGQDILGSLNRLVADFASGVVGATTAADLAELRKGMDNLSAQRSVLGASLSTIESTSTYYASEETNLKAGQSQLVATDTTAVATELSSNQTQQQALIAVITTLNKQNLFSQM